MAPSSKMELHYCCEAGEEVAVRTEEGWIIARVVGRNPHTKLYRVVDVEEPTMAFLLSSAHMVRLGTRRFSPGDKVYASYGDSSVLYRATITSTPGSGVEPFTYTVQFEDDVDLETGTTPDRSVSAFRIIQPSAGVEDPTVTTTATAAAAAAARPLPAPCHRREGVARRSWASTGARARLASLVGR